jgi:hypothetical protein
LRLGVHDLLDDGEQVKRRAGQSVDPRHRHDVAGGEGHEHFEKFAPVGARARHLLAVDVLVGASRAA